MNVLFQSMLINELMAELLKQKFIHKSHREAENVHIYHHISPSPLASGAHRMS